MLVESEFHKIKKMLFNALLNIVRRKIGDRALVVRMRMVRVLVADIAYRRHVPARRGRWGRRFNIVHQSVVGVRLSEIGVGGCTLPLVTGTS